MFNEDSIKPLPQETNQWLLRNFGFQVVNDELMRLQRVIVLRHDITDQILETQRWISSSSQTRFVP